MSSVKATPSRQSFQVLHPFDGHGALADLILRSSDNYDFYVAKSVLALASPIFRDMTTLPGPSHTLEDTFADGLPVVVMYESTAIILDTLLRVLYPITSPSLDDASILSGLLYAAQKYDMVAVLEQAKATMCRLCSDDGGRAMEVYALACEYKLEDEARFAAHRFLSYPHGSASCAALEHISGTAMFHLFDYRRAVAEKVDVLFSPVESVRMPEALQRIASYIQCPARRTSLTNGCGFNECGVTVSSWWSAVRETARSEAQKAPLSDNVLNVEVISKAASKAQCCSDCQTHVMRIMPSLINGVRNEIARLADEVSYFIGIPIAVLLTLSTRYP